MKSYVATRKEPFFPVVPDNLNDLDTLSKYLSDLRQSFYDFVYFFIDSHIMYGFGSPESTVIGIVGDLYMRKDGGSGTSLYVKEYGTGYTGWTGISSSQAEELYFDSASGLPGTIMQLIYQLPGIINTLENKISLLEQDIKIPEKETKFFSNNYKRRLGFGKGIEESVGLIWNKDIKLPYGDAKFIYSVCNIGDGICLATTSPGGRVLRSEDYGKTWNDHGKIIDPDGTSGRYVRSLCYLGHGICLAGYLNSGRIIRSTDYGKTWIDLGHQTNAEHINQISYLGNGICLAACSFYLNLLRSNDYGITWTDSGGGFDEREIFSVCYLEKGICLAGTRENGYILRSSNYGLSWTRSESFWRHVQILSICYVGNGVCLAGTGGDGRVLRSEDYGRTWPYSVKLNWPHQIEPEQYFVHALCHVGDGICFAGTGYGPKIFRSTDYGITWTEVNLPKLSRGQINSICSLGNDVLIAGKSLGGTPGIDYGGKILRSSNL